MAYWQIAAGSDQRTYADRFTCHGMAFVGGDAQVKAMAGVQPGDVVVLKQGMTSILAVGRVVARDGRHSGVNDKHWLLDFDGWELRAWCFVDWHVPDKPVSVSGLTRATIQRIHQGHLVAEADRILADFPAKASYDPEPAKTAPVTDDQMTRDLIDHGLRPGATEELTVALRRIRLLAGFYLGRKWDLTKEHEARTFLVIPLLQALGWAEQRIQIEWSIPEVGRADIACFRKSVRDGNEECSILIETKNLSQGLFYATDQVNRYASKIPACEVVIVTNGYCYKAYRRDPATGTFPALPTAYLNIRDPRTRYPLDPDNTDGALAVLQMLIPN